MNFISPSNLRLDGRKATEIRFVKFRIGEFQRASGSCHYQQGNTIVVASVKGPHEVAFQQSMKYERAVLNVEFSMERFSTGERRSRSRGDRLSIEMNGILKSTLESVVMLEKYPQTQIDLFVSVLQSDGSLKSACINAACLALINAGISINEFVVSCTSGYLDKTILCDLNYVEENAGGPVVPIAYLPRTKKASLIQMESKVSLDHFKDLMESSINGAKQIHQYLSQELKRQTIALIKQEPLIQS